jgi:hypothetical protein
MRRTSSDRNTHNTENSDTSHKMLFVFFKSSLWQWSSEPSLHLVARVSHYAPGPLFLDAKPWDSDGFLSTRWWTDCRQEQDVVTILPSSHVASGHCHGKSKCATFIQAWQGSQTVTKSQNEQHSFRPDKVLKLPRKVKMCNTHSGLTKLSNCHEKSKCATFIQAWQSSQTATKSPNVQHSFRPDKDLKLPRKVKMCNIHSGLTRFSNCQEKSKCATFIQAWQSSQTVKKSQNVQHSFRPDKVLRLPRGVQVCIV